MTTYECCATVLGGLTVLIAGVGLVGLWQYVKHTKSIAEATKLQGDVLTRPTISMCCSKRDTDGQQFSEINTEIRNNSMVHANIKVTIKACLHTDETNQDEEFSAPTPYDGTVWPFAAKQWFAGNFRFDELVAREITNADALTLVGIVESSALGSQNGFERNPTVLYHWKHSTESWVPDVPIPQ